MQCTSDEFLGRRSTTQGRMHWFQRSKREISIEPITHFQDIIESLSVWKLSCANSIEVLHTTPPGKFRHSGQGSFNLNDAGEKETHRFVSFPLLPNASKTTRRSTQRCFPHFPRSSECRVSYEYALYGSENLKSQRKCCAVALWWWASEWKTDNSFGIRLTSMLWSP